ncbi:hypothetical protein [Streptomyces flavovirens]
MAGAAGYVLKQINGADLVAVHTVAYPGTSMAGPEASDRRW